jgi:ubiquinone/menaquinone biosynthesis C-methylase UbiE
MSTQDPVAQHYTRGDLLARIDTALRAAGKDPADIAARDISSLDQFHTGGKPSTLELARLAGIRPEQEVLDVGGGIGGPARTLAEEIGCRVTVLDLTEEFIATGNELTRRTGLADRVRFEQGDATRLPFADFTFDMVITQHASMNISDKASLIREAHRVLRSGGRYALHDIMAGETHPILFPVPWAISADNSFLESPAAVRSLLQSQGFRELAWHDESEAAQKYFQERATAAQQQADNKLSVRLLLGDKAPAMFENLARNFSEHRVTAVMAVFEKP